MILKTLSRKDPSGTGQLLQYILRYILDTDKQELASDAFMIKKNLRGRTLREYIAEFKELNARRLYKRKDQPALHHVILSWHPKNAPKISDKMLHDMARQFMKLRGNNLYIGTKHVDRNHLHIHLMMSAVQLDGRSSRQSKAELATMKIKLDEYQRQKYPELENSLPCHGRKRSEREKRLRLKHVEDQRQRELTQLQSIRNKGQQQEKEREMDYSHGDLPAFHHVKC